MTGSLPNAKFASVTTNTAHNVDASILSQAAEPRPPSRGGNVYDSNQVKRFTFKFWDILRLAPGSPCPSVTPHSYSRGCLLQHFLKK